MKRALLIIIVVATSFAAPGAEARRPAGRAAAKKSHAVTPTAKRERRIDWKARQRAINCLLRSSPPAAEIS